MLSLPWLSYFDDTSFGLYALQCHSHVGYLIVLGLDLPGWIHFTILWSHFHCFYASVVWHLLVLEVLLSMDFHRTLANLGMSFRHLSQFWHDYQCVIHSFTSDIHAPDDKSECFFRTKIYFYPLVKYFKPFVQSCRYISTVLVTVTLQQYMYVSYLVFPRNLSNLWWCSSNCWSHRFA